MADHGNALLRPWGRILGGFSCRTNSFQEGITRIRLSSRVTRSNGMQVAVYWVGGVLIDSGFVHVREPLLQVLSSVELKSICLTHHHEDHSGACGPLARSHGCLVYLRNRAQRFDEGLSGLKPYRLLWWGVPDRYDPLEMPERIQADDRFLRVVPIPGHSATHTAFFDEGSGAVFTGDLVITGGVTAVMSHENPFESIASLRRVADLAPSRMLTGHGLAIERPAAMLREKADRIEQAAGEVLRLHRQGIHGRAIVRRLLPSGRAKDRFIEILTGGEFSRLNFVQACLERSRERPR